VSSVIAKYLGNGYLDYLQGKWYGQMHCFTKAQQQGARVSLCHIIVHNSTMVVIFMIAVALARPSA